MRFRLIRPIAALTAVAALALGSLAMVAPTEAAPCNRGQCQKEFRDCVRFCADNACLIDCEVRRDICLSSCSG